MGLPAPPAERQSVSRGELRGVLYALEQRRASEKMGVVLDSEYVYKGITEWPPKWQRHGRRVKSREIGRRDLGEAFYSFRQGAGALLLSVWTPSHMKEGGTMKRMHWQKQAGRCTRIIKRGGQGSQSVQYGDGRTWGCHRCVLTRRRGGGGAGFRCRVVAFGDRHIHVRGIRVGYRHKQWRIGV